jgi:hypothetical protein
LSDVPGVLVHGDVGTGLNVLADGVSFEIIDWETSVESELPLTDVLPLLCNALATRHGHRGAAEASRYILRLCAGDELDSRWLFGVVRSYCSQVRVPLGQAGALAALAWGYQASMRLVHEDLVRQTGSGISSWVTSADDVARQWCTHPGLGLSWTALTASS